MKIPHPRGGHAVFYTNMTPPLGTTDEILAPTAIRLTTATTFMAVVGMVLAAPSVEFTATFATTSMIPATTSPTPPTTNKGRDHPHEDCHTSSNSPPRRHIYHFCNYISLSAPYHSDSFHTSAHIPSPPARRHRHRPSTLCSRC